MDIYDHIIFISYNVTCLIFFDELKKGRVIDKIFIQAKTA